MPEGEKQSFLKESMRPDSISNLLQSSAIYLDTMCSNYEEKKVKMKKAQIVSVLRQGEFYKLHGGTFKNKK
jgi:hypothetical protein